VLHGPVAGRPTVTAACRLARAAGVRMGMSAAEARVLCPEAAAEEHRPDDDRAALGELADALLRFGPASAAEPDGSLWLDIAGCAHLFGGEEPLLAKALAMLRKRGLFAAAAGADTMGAARAVAHSSPPGTAAVIEPGGEPERLAGLPVERLRLDPGAAERLRLVGVRTVGALAALPRAQIPARFGEDVLRRLDQAFGRRPETFTPRRPPPCREARVELEDPVDRRDWVVRLAESLTARLLADLAAGDQGVREMECLLFPDGGPPAAAELVLTRPMRSLKRLMELLALRLEPLRPGGPVCAIAVRLLRTGRMIVEQLDWLDADDRRRREAFGELVDGLAAELGPDALLTAAPADEHQPERAVRLTPAAAGGVCSAAGGAGRGREGPPRPWRLLRRPRPVLVAAGTDDGRPIHFRLAGRTHRLPDAAGPERIETGWWRGRDVQRDYWTVEDDDGGRFWLYRHRFSGRWWLHGSYE
jgi:protein ImuB